LKSEAQEQIEPNKPYRILKIATCTKIKIKNNKTIKNMVNDTKLRTTQKIKEEKTLIS